MKANSLTRFIVAFGFIAFMAMAAHPALAKKSQFNLGAQIGGGYDTNVFNKAAATGALINENSAKFKFDHKLAKRITFKNGIGASSSYRSGGAANNALKFGVKAMTGMAWRIFGGGTADDFSMTGILDWGFNYSGTFNPALTNSTEVVTVIDEEDEVDDSFEDDVYSDDEGEFDADYDLDSGDDGEFTDEEDAEDYEDFVGGEDPLSGKFFNSKPARHNYTGRVGFTFKPFYKTSFGINAKATVGDIEERIGQVTSDSTQYGGGFMFSQGLFDKLLTISGGYNLGLRFYDEKTVAGGAALKMTAHSGAIMFKIKPWDRFKIDTGYRLGLTVVPPNTARNSMQHVGRLGVEWLALPKTKLSVFGENSILLSSLPNGARTTTRYQGLAGLRWRFK